MDFTESIKEFAKRIPAIKESVSTEEATKMSLVVPVFQMLGYDVFNPNEFCPEYTADVGIKKGEKVDYAIMNGKDPIILVECKSCNEELEKHSSQLFRYFGTTKAKFGILTNGIIYRFFTDLEESNKMDLVPFLEIDMLNLKDTLIPELRKFHKANFDTDKIFNTAEELKYTKLIKDYMQKEFETPSDDFSKLILSHVYDGVKTQKIIDKYTPLIKRALNSFVSDIVNQRLSAALDQTKAEEEKNEEIIAAPESKIITTEDEIQSFYIVRAILADVAPAEKISYRDTESYFGILFDDNNRKPICRINLDSKRMQIMLPDEKKNFEKFYIESILDIYKYKKKLIDIVKRYL